MPHKLVFIILKRMINISLLGLSGCSSNPYQVNHKKKQKQMKHINSDLNGNTTRLNIMYKANILMVKVSA